MMWCSGYKRLYERHVCINTEILILPKVNFNMLQAIEVKICLRVSHSKALPLILEIIQEFWP